MNYELFYLIGASKEAELDKIKGEAEEIVTKAEGVFSEKTTVEKRRLSYSIGRETHGIYIARRFELEKTENLKDINNKFNLNPGILRFIISRADELPELKSKEERMDEAAKRERQPQAQKEKKEIAAKKESPEKTKKGKEGEEKSSEDIDKKLEEILNI